MKIQVIIEIIGIGIISWILVYFYNGMKDPDSWERRGWDIIFSIIAALWCIIFITRWILINWEVSWPGVYDMIQTTAC